MISVNNNHRNSNRTQQNKALNCCFLLSQPFKSVFYLQYPLGSVTVVWWLLMFSLKWHNIYVKLWCFLFWFKYMKIVSSPAINLFHTDIFFPAQLAQHAPDEHNLYHHLWPI